MEDVVKPHLCTKEELHNSRQEANEHANSVRHIGTAQHTAKWHIMRSIPHIRHEQTNKPNITKWQTNFDTG